MGSACQAAGSGLERVAKVISAKNETEERQPTLREAAARLHPSAPGDRRDNTHFIAIFEHRIGPI